MKDINCQPVIIIGSARSGTNLLRDLLTAHGDVSTWPCDEINYLWRFGNARFPTDELRTEHAGPRTKSYLRSHFSTLAKQTKSRWIVEKTCANSLRVDFVHEIIPEAKFIFLVRDGLDVAASAVGRWRAPLDIAYLRRKAAYVPWQDLYYYAAKFLKHRTSQLFSRNHCLPTWGPRFQGMDEMLQTLPLSEVCLWQWKKCIESASRALIRLPREQVFFLRYSALVTEPTQHLRQLFTFLGCQTSFLQLEDIAKRVFADRVGRGRIDFSPKSLLTLEPLAEETFAKITEEWNSAFREPSSLYAA